MSNTFIKIVALAACLVLLVGSIPVFGASYSSYTYSINGQAQASPAAYTPLSVHDSKSLGLGEKPLDAPTAIETDSEGNVYIADPKNNRIVVLDKFYSYQFEITDFINSEGVSDDLNQPQGLFVWEGRDVTENNEYVDAKYIYVADTENNRIVVFDAAGEYLRHIEQPESEVFEEGEIYKPSQLAVDEAGRIYVVSTTTYQGIITLTKDGVFAGYIGAQAVSYSLMQAIWRKFQTAEQIAQQEQNISTEFNNITIDSEGFVYVTTDTIKESDVTGAIKSKAATYATVKKLNMAGDDIMRRNGFFSPMGEVNFTSSLLSSATNEGAYGPSKIVDVAIGPQGTWSIIDQKRSKIYTYNDNGELLFVFGDTGTQLGNLQMVTSIVYQGDKILVLDKQTGAFTVYGRTTYGDLLLTAIQHNNDRLYSLAAEDWKAILQRNNNFDAAYIGLGQAYHRQGQYETAMEYFKVAYDTADYSESFKMYRQLWVQKYAYIIVIVVVVALAAYYFLFKWAGNVNKHAAVSGRRKTFVQEVLYAFHIMFHPFDGFWDLKHEKRGSVRAALFWLALVIASFSYQSVGQSFLFNPRGGFSGFVTQLTGIGVPLALFVIANWCFTTLMEGEGSFKDVFIASCYSLAPLTLFIVPCTLLTHVVTSAEQGFITIILGICYVWVGMLLFFGIMVTHDYSLGKNILTLVCTIVGMVLIMFLVVLFSSLCMKMVSFVSNIITEITYRM